MISVVIPLYNKERTIAKTLRSVLNQSYQDFEIVIVNDGSTDRSEEEVKKISDYRINVISQKNAGVSVARNRGSLEAKGDIIAFLDADDEWDVDYLHTIHDLSSTHPDCQVFGTRYEFIDEYGNHRLATLNEIDLCDGVINNYFHTSSLSDAPLWTSAVAVKKSALLDIGGFPVDITSGEDLLTWARLAVKYKIAYCDEAKARYYTPTTGPTGKVPADLESTNDSVGKALIELAKEYPDKRIHEYISFWYKMRAVINLGRGNRMPAMQCALKSIRFHPTNIKAWVLSVLSIMPKTIIQKALKK